RAWCGWPSLRHSGPPNGKSCRSPSRRPRNRRPRARDRSTWLAESRSRRRRRSARGQTTQRNRRRKWRSRPRRPSRSRWAIPGNRRRFRASEATPLGQQALGVPRGAMAPTFFGAKDGHELLGRFFQLFVHEHVVEEPIVFDLAQSDPEASLHGVFVLACPAAQALLEDGHARRQDEHRHRVGRGALDLTRTLVVDVEDDPTRTHAALELRLPRAVQIAVHLGPLQKRTLLDQAQKLLAIDEMVFASVLLVLSWLARGVRHAETQLGDLLEQTRRERGLARAGGRGHDQG